MSSKAEKWASRGGKASRLHDWNNLVATQGRQDAGAVQRRKGSNPSGKSGAAPARWCSKADMPKAEAWRSLASCSFWMMARVSESSGRRGLAMPAGPRLPLLPLLPPPTPPPTPPLLLLPLQSAAGWEASGSGSSAQECVPLASASVMFAA